MNSDAGDHSRSGPRGDTRAIRLVESGRETLWNSCTDFQPLFAEVGAPFPPVEHLERIKQSGGEKIVLVDDADMILGWIGIIPAPENGFAELAGIQVHADFRNRGYGTALILEAQQYLCERDIHRFVFQTSPLMAGNAALYIHTFGTRYTWNGSQLAPPHGIPWPVVDCEMTWGEPGTRRPGGTFNFGADGAASDPPAGADGDGGAGPEAGDSIVSWNGLSPELDEARLLDTARPKQFALPFLSLPLLYPMITEGRRELFDVADRVFSTLCGGGFEIVAFHSCPADGLFAYQFALGGTISPDAG